MRRIAYLAPFVEEADHYFLKTAIPSRKATRKYLHAGGASDVEDDAYEAEILSAYERRTLKSVGSRAEIAELRAAARATATKDRPVSMRLSTGDSQDIQVKAMGQGLYYQTLIVSVLHKCVSGRLQEADDPLTAAAPRRKAATASPKDKL